MKTKHIILIFAALLLIGACSKNKVETTKEKEDMEVEDILLKDTIEGVYIPKNLEDSFRELDKTLSDEDKEYIKNLENRDETIRLHRGLGMWMRNHWKLWGDSRFSTYLLHKGIDHPDDMSSTVLEFYYDWLNGDHAAWREWENKEPIGHPYEPPYFPDGDQALYKWLYDHMEYPQEAKEKRIHGKVEVKFVVLEDGTIGRINIDKNSNPLLSNEAIRLVENLPRFVSAKWRGEPTSGWYAISLDFSLPDRP